MREILSVDNYLKFRDYVAEEGFEKVLAHEVEKLKKLFKEMLIYKKKSFREEADFLELLDKVYYDYHYFESEIIRVKDAVKYGTMVSDPYYEEESVTLDDVDIILTVMDLYLRLLNKENGYKKYAYYYQDYNLYDYHAYDEILEKECEKLRKLFMKVLDFLKITYKKDSSFWDLLYLVCDNYQYYRNVLIRINTELKLPINTPIEKIHLVQEAYSVIENSYIDYENNVNKKPLL